MSVATETTLTALPEPGIVIDDSPFEPARLSIDTYHRLLETEAFADGARFELLEGVLVEKMIKKRPHVVASAQTDAAILAVLPAGWHLQRQDPLSLGESEPEPDLAVVHGAAVDYPSHPTGADVGLTVEIAESSLRDDRRKARIYGKARIPLYWIVNLEDRTVECYSEPYQQSRRNGFRTMTVYLEDESIPFVLDGVTVAQFAVRDLLPPVMP